MNKEVEIQVKIKNPAEAERKIRKIAKYLGSRIQVDKYFNPPHKNYFSRYQPLEYIRIRSEKNKNHFAYTCLHFDTNDRYKLLATNEYETEIKNPDILEEILIKTGFVHVLTVKKRRKYFNRGNFILNLDNVKGLGDFLEIEAKRVIKNIKNTHRLVVKFLEHLKIDYEFNAKKAGYPKMLFHKLKKRK